MFLLHSILLMTQLTAGNGDPMAEHLPGTHRALGLIPALKEKLLEKKGAYEFLKDSNCALILLCPHRPGLLNLRTAHSNRRQVSLSCRGN